MRAVQKWLMRYVVNGRILWRATTLSKDLGAISMGCGAVMGMIAQLLHAIMEAVDTLPLQVSW